MVHLKVLIIGLGSIAQKHITALLQIDKNCEIFALRSSNKIDVYPNVKNIYHIDDIPVVDFALITNPTHLHGEYISILAYDNIPLFIEKPMVHTLIGLNDLVAEIEKRKVFTYVACNLRFHPCLQFLENYIKKSPVYVNEVNVYCGSYLPDWRPGKDFKKIYSSNASMGGGVHLDLFHEIDYVCWIFGLPLKVDVHKTSNSTLNLNAVDYANYRLCYDTFTVNVILNYFRRVAKREIEIVFENDIWTIDLIKNNIKNSMGDILFHQEDFSIIDTYYVQLEYFINQLKSNKKIMNTAAESADILKICLIDEQ